jgi:hypothetical protein
MTRDLFEDYIRTVFIPAVETNHRPPGCQSKPAILFCDKCACHCAQDTLTELAHPGVLVMTCPLHSSQIFQLLDLLLVGRFKAAKKHPMRDPTVSPRRDHVMRLFRADELASINSTVGGSWEKIGFDFTRRDGTHYLCVDEPKIRGIREFAEVCDIDYSETALSARRRQQRWGWLNEEMFRLEYVSMDEREAHRE